MEPKSPSFGEKSIRKISKDLKKLKPDSIKIEKKTNFERLFTAATD